MFGGEYTRALIANGVMCPEIVFRRRKQKGNPTQSKRNSRMSPIFLAVRHPPAGGHARYNRGRRYGQLNLLIKMVAHTTRNVDLVILDGAGD